MRHAGKAYIRHGIYRGAVDICKEVVVKLSADVSSLQKEYQTLKALQVSNRFIETIDLVEPKDIQSSDAAHTLSSAYGMVMARGSTDLLSMIARQSKYSITELYHMVSSVLSVVEAAHDRDIAWMDIKPANFVYSNLIIQGIDMGSAIQLNSGVVPEQLSLTTRYMCPVTATCMLLGGGGIAEGVSGRAYDMWAVGMTVLELVNAGNTFIDGPTDEVEIMTLLQHLTQEKVNAYISRSVSDGKLRHILLNTLVIDPSKRKDASVLFTSLNTTSSDTHRTMVQLMSRVGTAVEEVAEGIQESKFDIMNVAAAQQALTVDVSNRLAASSIK